MACCRSAPDDAGYATPAALVFSLALALVGAAMVGRSVMALRLSRADFERTRAEYDMAGAQLAAAAAVVRSNVTGPYHWTFTTDGGWIDAIAEREADKLSLSAASVIADATLADFGVKDPAALKSRLADAQASNGQVVNLASLDDADLWRACAATMASPFGEQTTFTYQAPSEPGPGPKPASWRIGETWRIRVTTTAGWRDDRIVRFTGDARHPVAVVVRRVSRGEGDGGRCKDLFERLSAQ